MTYYSLLTRCDVTGRWGVHFGDYDKETVQCERIDLLDEMPSYNAPIDTATEPHWMEGP